jgi:hypothetical protein
MLRITRTRIHLGFAAVAAATGTHEGAAVAALLLAQELLRALARDRLAHTSGWGGAAADPVRAASTTSP